MIAWQFPAALWALPLAAVPLLIHLLRMHRAERQPFPSLRFVRSSQTASVRPQAPSDLWLMLLRMAAVALAVAAAAGPLLVTPGRVAGWNERTARAVIVDVSASMRDGPPGQTPAELADEAAGAEIAASTYSHRIDSADPGDALARARAWLDASPPSRREIVVISDFQRGTLTRSQPDVTAIPAAIGLRFVAVGQAAERREADGGLVLAAPGAARRQTIDLAPDTTAVTLAGPPIEATGVRIDPPASGERLLRVAAAVGTPAGSSSQPIAIRFADSEGPRSSGATRLAPGWMLDTAMRLQRDPDVIAAASATTAVDPPQGSSASRDTWLVLVRDGGGRPLVTAASQEPALAIDVAAPGDVLLAAAVVRAVLAARQPPGRLAELEPARIDAAALASWGRQPAAVTAPTLTGGWRGGAETDARWCWLAILAALGVEQWLRTRRGRGGDAAGEVTHAAA